MLPPFLWHFLHQFGTLIPPGGVAPHRKHSNSSLERRFVVNFYHVNLRFFEDVLEHWKKLFFKLKIVLFLELEVFQEARCFELKIVLFSRFRCLLDGTK